MPEDRFWAAGGSRQHPKLCEMAQNQRAGAKTGAALGEGSAREHIPPAKPQLCLAQPGAGSAQHPQEPCWAGAALPGLFFLLNIKISEVPKSTAPTPTAAMSSAGASRVLGAAGPALDPAELPGGKAWAPLPGPHPARSCAKPGCRGGS